jgi:ABC-type polysaccharide/polyol phosphate export permease
MQSSAAARAALGELVHYRHLLASLIWRDLRVRYKQSVLGMAWAVVMPLAMMLIFTFVFTRAVKVVDGLELSMPYPLFAYLGLVPWAFFSAGLLGCVNALVANRNLVTKVYFPREVFPLATIGAAFVDFCIAGVVLAGLIVYFDVTTDWDFHLSPAALFLPVVIVVQLLFTCGLGMLLAMANLFYRDVRQILGVAVQLWMFLTCVVYPIRNDGSWWGILAVGNPMTPIIQAYRDCLIEGRIPHGGAFWTACAVSIGVFVGGWALFRRMSWKFAEYI